MGFFTDFINTLSTPIYSFTLMIVAFVVMIQWKAPWSKRGGQIMLAVGVVYFSISLFQYDFRLIMTKADNVPIVMMIFLVGFFMWLAMHKGIENDKRIDRGEPTFELSEIGGRSLDPLQANRRDGSRKLQNHHRGQLPLRPVERCFQTS